MRQPLEDHITLTISFAVARDTGRSLLTIDLYNLMAVMIHSQSGCRRLNHGLMVNIVSSVPNSGMEWHYHRAIDPMLYHLSNEAASHHAIGISFGH